MPNQTQAEVNRLNLGKSYVERRQFVAAMPARLIIESTSVCNLKCIMCPYPIMGRKNQHMSFDLYRKIIEEAAGTVEFVWLHLFGEPLLNPNIYKMIDLAENAGIRTGLSTNATRLNTDASAALLNTQLSLLLLCLDGATRETYEQIRVGARFDAVSANIAQFAAMKAQRKTRMRASVQMIDMNLNAAERALFLEQWRDSGLDGVHLKGFHTWAGQNQELIQFGADQIPHAAAACSEPWISLTVLSDGRVVPCCNDYSADMCLGDLNFQSIREVWNGPEVVSLRRRFQGEPADVAGTICERCPFPTATREQAAEGTGPFDPVHEALSLYSPS